MELETILVLIGNFGFPIVIALYLLLRFEKKIDDLSFAIRDLENIVRDIDKDIRYKK